LAHVGLNLRVASGADAQLRRGSGRGRLLLLRGRRRLRAAGRGQSDDAEEKSDAAHVDAFRVVSVVDQGFAFSRDGCQPVPHRELFSISVEKSKALPRRSAIAGLTAAVVGTACRAAPRPFRRSYPTLDDFAERYVRLTLRLARHQPSLVEAWLGPAAWEPD